MASMEPLLICCLMAHNSRKNGSPTVSCEQGSGVRGQDLISPLSSLCSSLQALGCWHPTHCLLQMLIPSPTLGCLHCIPARDQPLSLKLREGKHPAQQCTEGTSKMVLLCLRRSLSTKLESAQIELSSSRSEKKPPGNPRRRSLGCWPKQASHATSCHGHYDHCSPKRALPDTLD